MYRYGLIALIVALTACGDSNSQRNAPAVSSSPEATVTPALTATPSAAPTAAPTATPTHSPTPAASPLPSATASPTPTASTSPAATPTASPTASPENDNPLVDLAAVCRAVVPGELGILCEAIQSTTGELSAQCRAATDAAFCDTFRGNVYALVRSCYSEGGALFGEQSRTVCKAADTLVSGMASFCRQTILPPPQVCSLMSETLIADSVIAQYQQSTLHTAHRLQRELAADLPMRNTLYVATHNSFNASDANTPPTLSGLDANQRYTLVNQLNMDVRGIELDVHWLPSVVDGGFRPTVCHGNVQHIGCTLEKSLRDELTELRVWLDQHPDQVLVIGLETHFEEPLDSVTGSDQYSQASTVIQEVIGDLLFRPEVDTERSCEQGQPLDTSINQVRAAGKQLIVYGDCKYGIDDANQVFSTSGTHKQQGAGSYIGIQAPDNCGFSLDEINDLWVRYYEDGTLVGAAVSGVERQANAQEIQQMARCNINMPSVDHLLPFDGRLQAFVWSWDHGEPASVAGDARAVHNAAGHFQAIAAAAAPASKACLNPDQPVIIDGQLNSQRWHIASDCVAPARWATPRHGLDNELLKQTKAAAGISSISLSLQRPAGGDWLVN